MNAFIAHLIDDAGYISPRAVAEVFIKEVAAISGLSPDTVAKKSRFRSKASQKRLHDIVIILNRILH